ncbi:MAG TPA: galactose-1-phosphate uridylyltransferase [Burkholderiales bacterium]|nr:galactose-1-phosphate uridylyltransferase [Burkholderiales bacterium]
MQRVALAKPDGRQLILYSRRAIRHGPAPSPFAAPLAGRPALRWHPLRGEWVTYAAYRQDRTFLPPPEYNPLAPTADPAQPTELPAGDWEIAVFDNRFPALLPPQGKCEVVVFTQDPSTSLGALPLERIELLFEVWAERTERLGAMPQVRYVLPFENRGQEVGVTLHHPHGQIYAYPVVPPVPARMLAQPHEGRLEHVIRRELDERARLLYRGEHAVAFVPFCARYPYEVWVAPIARVESFAELDAAVRGDLARALKTVLLKYDGLWGRPMPYLMAWFQAPTGGARHPGAHLHAELYPPYRTRERLKYLAGTELAAGFFAMDALPEDKARELQQVEVRLA